ncbi:STAS domain-containing protein [Streptomyces sp. NPDC060064]|uniref:STAS domain-containing protein n=1 Tax=Streptomyces sp. NPDC060064 TaxID=3347049 RepID=UPI0036C4C458
MPLPRLTIHRHDSESRALITLAGEIDLETAPLVRETLKRCLRDGIRTVDIDLAPVSFCDCSGLNAFLEASQHATTAGGALQLHYPPPTLARLVELTGSGFLLRGLPDLQGPPPRREGIVAITPAQLSAPFHSAPHGPAPAVTAATGGVL